MYRVRGNQDTSGQAEKAMISIFRGDVKARLEMRLLTAASCYLPYVFMASSPRLSILNYHRVLSARDPLRPFEPTAVEFSRKMEVLARCFNPLGLAEALTLMQQNKLPKRAVCVTFDDGYADNLQVALPVLQRWRIPATVFVSSGYIDRNSMWNDRVIESVRQWVEKGNTHLDLSLLGLGAHNCTNTDDCLVTIERLLEKIKYCSSGERSALVEGIERKVNVSVGSLMMSRKELQALYLSGVTIGAHTHTHPILSGLSEEDSHFEIATSKRILESWLQAPVDYFAYPNGRFDKDYGLLQQDQVKALGFKAALSTNPGVASEASNIWQLPRFTPWDKQSWRYMLRLMLSRRCLA